MNENPIIVLLTDFGLTDAYVGTMKGVMLSICPAAHLVDLTHAIEPQNIRQAAYVLLTAFRYFPADTIFLIVVDPGVGTTREPAAVETEHGFYVAPDNGVLSYVLRQVHVKQVVTLQNPAYRLPTLSQTFHGRDIFGPAAAHLAKGVPISELGPAQLSLVTLNDPVMEVLPSSIRGEVLHIDHFGNIITSIGRLTWTTGDSLRLEPIFGLNRESLSAIPRLSCKITIGTYTLDKLNLTYGAVPPGDLTALVGSSGQLEIGVNQGHAARALSVSMGDPVQVLWGT
ncbi:MAG: SAM-dependent chlorinase/fluorinase [Chloroflexi bacterium]|nr:SAM-dependent chlorinase/fluorinase [Chloroflexota bacterium]